MKNPPLIDHPLSPLIEAYLFARLDRATFCSDENIEKLQRAIDALNAALRDSKEDRNA